MGGGRQALAGVGGRRRFLGTGWQFREVNVVERADFVLCVFYDSKKKKFFFFSNLMVYELHLRLKRKENLRR